MTAQNTLGVNRVDALPPEAVREQIDAVVQHIGVDAYWCRCGQNRDVAEPRNYCNGCRTGAIISWFNKFSAGSGDDVSHRRPTY